jgi:hypothetical protein
MFRDPTRLEKTWYPWKNMAPALIKRLVGTMPPDEDSYTYGRLRGPCTGAARGTMVPSLARKSLDMTLDTILIITRYNQ